MEKQVTLQSFTYTVYMIDLIIRTLMYMYSVVCNAAKVVVMTNDAFVYGNKEK